MQGQRSTLPSSVPVPAASLRQLSVPSRQCMEVEAQIHGSVGDGMIAVGRISDAGFQELLQLQPLAPSAVLRPATKKR